MNNRVTWFMVVICPIDRLRENHSRSFVEVPELPLERPQRLHVERGGVVVLAVLPAPLLVDEGEAADEAHRVHPHHLSLARVAHSLGRAEKGVQMRSSLPDFKRQNCLME